MKGPLDWLRRVSRIQRPDMVLLGGVLWSHPAAEIVIAKQTLAGPIYGVARASLQR